MSRVEAPSSCKEGNFIDIGTKRIRAGEGSAFNNFGIVVTLQIEFVFGLSRATLFPKGLSRPDIGAKHFAGIGLDPGMMVQHATEAEELDVPQLAAQINYETVTRVDVFAGVG